MLIRKLLKFESAHIVPGCSGQRCSATYEVEVLLGGGGALDHGQMAYDFGLLRATADDFYRRLRSCLDALR